MRSFARQVKDEIIRCERTDAEYKAEFSALLQFLSTISISGRGLTIVMRTENADLSVFLMKMIKQYYGAKTETEIIRKTNLNKNRVYSIRILDQCRRILEDLGLWTKEGLMSHPSRSMTDARDRAKAYLAGCFLAAGSVNDPRKPDYHLEISCQTEDLSRYLLRLLKKMNTPGKCIRRRNLYVVYIKSADYINDFLYYTGAVQCSLDYADIKIRRDFLNSVTRLENCQTANEVKAIRTAHEQLDAIDELERTGRFDKLDDKVKDAAILRMENPEASLKELCSKYEQKTGQKISKSGMKHRMEKILESVPRRQRDV